MTVDPKSVPPGVNQVCRQLQLARKDLLDVGLRNNLLNFRTRSKAGGKLLPKRVQVVDEIPAEVFRILVTQGRKMTFLPREEPETKVEAAPPVAPNEAAEAAEALERHTDRRLQTLLQLDRLQDELLDIHRAARTLIEEQGVNSLFLALGALTWFEADASSEPRVAPLILVPVAVERSTAKERFQLAFTGDEITRNYSLEAMLAEDFAVKLPVFGEDDLDVNAYLAAVGDAVAAERRWSVDASAMHLAFFSFSKFLMYRDLDPEVWPENARPEGNDVIGQLLGPSGFRQQPSPIGDEDFLDPLLDPTQVHHVLDADSSQAVVIADAVSGRNLVVQGPPGTGKSQTITNLIAEAVGAGKRVLFVSEKMAALDVVKRRLDNVGLGDLTLELHSNKTSKKVLLDELKRTMELVRPSQLLDEAGVAALVAARDRLNRYADLVNTPMGLSGISLHDAIGLLLRYRQSVFPGALDLKLEPGALLSWSRADIERKRALLNDLTAWVARNGPPLEHPFWGSRKLVHLPTDEPPIRAALEAASKRLEFLLGALQPMAAGLGLPLPQTLGEAARFLRAVGRAADAPDLSGLNPADDGWTRQGDELMAAIEAGARSTGLLGQAGASLKPQAWQADVSAARDAVARYGKRWWRVLSGAYRASQRSLRELAAGAPERDPDRQLALLDTILQVQADRKLLGARHRLASGLFGARWDGEPRDWTALMRVAGWVRALQASVTGGELPAWALTQLPPRANAAPFAPQARQALESLEAARSDLTRLRGLLDLDEAARFGEGGHLITQGLRSLQKLLGVWLQRLPELQAAARLNQLSGQLAGEGLAIALSLARSQPALAGRLGDQLHVDWLFALVRSTYEANPELAGFDGTDHDALVKRFRELDKLVLKFHRSRLAQMHWERLPKGDASGQLGALRHQFELKSRHMAVRQLMARAGNAIQALKPVMMMSPLSIANFLPPGALDFDLVIFDEASQVRPADALGALLRGRQAVVVGDSKQLGPTNFFERVLSGEDDDEDDNAEESATADIESVLGLFTARACPQRMLTWHYRSRHQSLIAVSNKLFYGNKLVIFPSPNDGQGRYGVFYHHLPGTIYDRGGSRTNLGEAGAVVQAVLLHARTNAQFTLGVAAFSSAQARAIEDQLEVARKQYPELEAFMHEHRFEPFFVKNLETVQGDERDVILISVGYGRDAAGKLTQNFGPLNAKGGERRLNVLITRARMRCEVFTNLSADDIQTTGESPEGVRALKEYLEYAATGKLQLPSESSRGPDSPFEEAVRDALVAGGYTVQPQVGAAGYFIDLAVVDPARPGRYLLGVECDGATYHSARSARDRDRLRQQVLENLGWRMHRIWSTDWFRDPAAELRRVIAAIEGARNQPDWPAGAGSPPTSSATAGPPTPPAEIEPPAAGAAPEAAPEYVVSRPSVTRAKGNGTELHAVKPAVLAGWLEEVVRVEGPIHESEAAARVAEAYGVGRVGNRIRETMERGVRAALGCGAFERRAGFLWAKGVTEAPVRDRSSLPPAFRNMDLVCDEEIAGALERVVRASYGIPPQDAPVAAARLLGFARLTNEARSRVDGVTAALLRGGRLALHNEFLVLP